MSDLSECIDAILHTEFLPEAVHTFNQYPDRNTIGIALSVVSEWGHPRRDFIRAIWTKNMVVQDDIFSYRLPHNPTHNDILKWLNTGDMRASEYLIKNNVIPTDTLRRNNKYLAYCSPEFVLNMDALGIHPDRGMLRYSLAYHNHTVSRFLVSQMGIEPASCDVSLCMHVGNISDAVWLLENTHIPVSMLDIFMYGLLDCMDTLLSAASNVSDRYDACEWLLQRGVVDDWLYEILDSRELPHNGKYNLIGLAIMYNRLDVVRLYVESHGPDAAAPGGPSPLMISRVFNRVGISSFLLNEGGTEFGRWRCPPGYFADNNRFRYGLQ